MNKLSSRVSDYSTIPEPNLLFAGGGEQHLTGAARQPVAVVFADGEVEAQTRAADPAGVDQRPQPQPFAGHVLLQAHRHRGRARVRLAQGRQGRGKHHRHRRHRRPQQRHRPHPQRRRPRAPRAGRWNGAGVPTRDACPAATVRR